MIPLFLQVTQIDWAQLILPLESQNVAIREQLARIDPADICLLDQQIHFFPQKTGCCALLNKRIRSVSTIYQHYLLLILIQFV